MMAINNLVPASRMKKRHQQTTPFPLKASFHGGLTILNSAIWLIAESATGNLQTILDHAGGVDNVGLRPGLFWSAVRKE